MAMYGVCFVDHEDPSIKQLVCVARSLADAAMYKEMWQDSNQSLELVEIPFLDIRKSPYDLNSIIGDEEWRAKYPNELSNPLPAYNPYFRRDPYGNE